MKLLILVSFLVMPSIVAARADSVKNRIHVQDSSHYSHGFLRALQASEVTINAGLYGRHMIFASGDTVSLPGMANPMSFVSRVKGDQRTVEIFPDTYSSVRFEIRDAKRQLIVKGKAEVNGMFWLGSEIDEDESGSGYPVDEYAVQDPDCYYSLRIGQPETGALRLRISTACDLGTIQAGEFTQVR